MGIRVVDNATGELVEVDSADAAAGHLDGRYGLPDVGRVRVRLQDGSVGDVEPGEAHVILREGGALLDESEYEAVRPTTLGEDIEVGARGFAEGLVPAGDAALLQMRQHARSQQEVEDIDRAMGQIQMERERSPVAHGVGELAGMAAGALLMGPGGAAETAGTGLLARAGRTALREGGEAMLQQIPRSTTRVVAEDALGDHDLTAEQLLAQVGVETLLAGGTGGLFGVGSRLAGEGLQALGRRLAPAIRSAVSDDAIREFAERSAFKSSGAMLADFRRAERSIGVRTIGRRLLDEGVVTWDASLDDIAQRAAARAGHHGEQIGALLRRLDEVPQGGYRTGAGTVRPNVDRILARIDNEVLDPLRGSPFHRGVLGQVEETLGGFRGRFASRLDDAGKVVPGDELSWTGLHEQRRALDDLIWRNRGPNPPQWIEEARKARRILEEELEAQGEAAAQRVGGDSFAAAYRDAKQGYAAMKTARDIAQDRLLREDANRFFSPSDYGIGSVGSLLHAVGGGGINPGSLAMGFLTGAIHKVIRERGRAFVAAGLDRVSRLGLLQQTAARAEKRLAEATRGFIREGGRAAARTAKRAAPVATVEAFREQIRSLTEDTTPERRVEAMSKATQGFADIAPRTTVALQSAISRRDEFLRARVPAAALRADPLQPHLSRPNVSDAERQRFMRYVEAVDNPMQIVEDLERGRITREGVEALREVYPRLYERIQRTVMEELAGLERPMPYPQRLQLGILLDIPTDPSLRPESIAMLQARYAQPPSAPPTPAPEAMAPSPELAAAHASETDRLVARRSGAV